jgi:hypothetical protein
VADYDFDNAEGDIEGGGRFDIKVDADTEAVLLGGIGLMQRRVKIGPRVTSWASSSTLLTGK